MSEIPKLLPIRFSPEADELLRPVGSMRGDLVRRVLEALAATDWTTVPIENRRRGPKKAPDGGYVVTTIQIEADLHRRLTAAARERSTSISALVDGCVCAYWGRS